MSEQGEDNDAVFQDDGDGGDSDEEMADGPDDVVSASQELVAVDSEKGFADRFLVLTGKLGELAAKTPVEKRLVVRYYKGAGDKLYSCDSAGRLITTMVGYYECDRLIFCNGTPDRFRDRHQVLFDDTLPLVVAVGDSFSLTIYYPKRYLFYDEKSFALWEVPIRGYMTGGRAIITVEAVV